MKKKQIIKQFPIEVNITATMLKNAKLYDPWNCIGARALRKALRKINLGKRIIKWGYSNGYIILNNTCDMKKYKKGLIIVNTSEGIDFTEITKPTSVTFKIIT